MHRPAKTRSKSKMTLEDYVLLGRSDEVSTSEIQKVYRELTLEGCTLPIIQLALSGLKADLLPEYAGESYDEEATEERAFRCILLLFKCALACSTNPQLRADAKDPVIDAADGVCGWINYSMTTRGLQIYHSDGEDIRNLQEAAFHQCNTIRAILGIHPSIVEAFLETRDFLPVVYWMWTMMDPKGPPGPSFFIRTNNPKSDPILDLLATVLQSPIGGRAVSQYAVHMGAASFVQATIGRAIQARTALSSAHPPPMIVPYSLSLFSVLESLLSPDSSELRDSFTHTGEYITEFSLLLHALTLSSSEQGVRGLVAVPDPHVIISPVATLFSTLDKHHRVSRNLGFLLAGKIDVSIAHGMLRLSATQDNCHPDCRYILKNAISLITLGSVYPAVLRPALLFKQDKGDEAVREKGIRSIRDPELRDAYSAFLRPVRKGAVLLESLLSSHVHFTQCDNITCKGDHQTASRQCSGCSSTIYCSAKCQEKDWKRHHRFECSQAQRDHRVNKRTGTWYSHLSRAYHEKLLVSQYNEHVEKHGGRLAWGNHTAQYRPLPVALISFYYGEASCDVRAMSVDSDDFVNREGTKLSQEYKIPRLKSLGREFRSGAKSMANGYRLVEGFLPLGPENHYVYLTALAQEKRGVYEIVYSVGRVGIMCSDTQ